MNFLAQIASGTGTLVEIVKIVGAVVIVGLVVKYLNPQQYIKEPFWSILVAICVVAFALWGLRTFF